uniref:cysteine synthase n=1 Tax=Candidatus Kentrum sp. LFY TaxID=2126342 RepID=A0A450U932_9GAMM|nr:MAG: cysteine synthase A [Candidatus Kentron sp. LFY]VFJ91449.1 MAG: cysteine synthase A [Candidatus Kentron sp. LFY]
MAVFFRMTSDTLTMKHILSVEKMLQVVPIAQLGHIRDNTVYTLLEKFNLCGSIKVKAVYWMIKNAFQRGDLTEGKTILEASSGNTAIALAYIGKLFGFPVLLVIPKDTGSCKKELMRSYGANLIEIDGITDDCIDFRNRMAERKPTEYFVLDQFNNPDNPEAHYHLTAPYIVDKLGKIDFFVAGLGTAGTLIGAGKYLKERFPEIRIVAINPLDRIEGIKNYHTLRNIGQFYTDNKHLIDDVIDVVFDDDVVPGLNDYLSEGYFNGVSSGAILTGTKRFLQGKKGLTGVIVAPDGGDYYLSEIIHLLDPKQVKACQ